MTPNPVTVYRHGADLSLCYPLMWNVTLEYTATHFNVLGETRPGNPFPTFHTQQRMLNLMLLWWLTVGSSVESTVPTGSWTRDLWCANPLRYPLAHSDFLYSMRPSHIANFWMHKMLTWCLRWRANTESRSRPRSSLANACIFSFIQSFSSSHKFWYISMLEAPSNVFSLSSFNLFNLSHLQICEYVNGDY